MKRSAHLKLTRPMGTNVNLFQLGVETSTRTGVRECQLAQRGVHMQGGVETDVWLMLVNGNETCSLIA